MHLTCEAILCAVLAHGEHGVIARMLTASDGLVAGYVRGGRSRKLRPVLMPGNLVHATLRARVDEQLPAAQVELLRSRAGLALDRLSAAALDWLTALTAATLPEGQPYPAVHAALTGLVDVIEHGDDPKVWAAGIARYELLLLAQLGFGLDLDECAATGGRNDLAFVSPKSSKAVSRAAGAPYAARLLPLPAFLRKAGDADWPAIVDGLRTTGWFVERELLGDWRARILPSRERLVARIAARNG